MRVTLRQLLYFDTLARHLHFGRAAEACKVSQPALSMQIQQLEGTLGLQLIERGRELALTAAGREILERARRILGEVRDLEATAQRGAGSGTLRLGVIPTIAPYLLPRLLALWRTLDPVIELQIQESRTARLIEELSRGALDVLLLALPVEADNVLTEPLFEDPFLLAAPADLPLPRRLTLPAIAEQRLLLLEEGHCLRDQALSVCHSAGRDSLATYGASSLATLIELVAARHGVTLVPRICAGALAGDRRIKLVRIAEPEPSRTVGLAWRASTTRGEVLDRLAALVRTAAGGDDAPAGV